MHLHCDIVRAKGASTGLAASRVRARLMYTHPIISNFYYYDCRLLVDDDDQMYVSYGKWAPDGSKSIIWVAQPTKDGLQNQKS
jgi:hypothetical protein